jgi:hypothetical protein
MERFLCGWNGAIVMKARPRLNHLVKTLKGKNLTATMRPLQGQAYIAPSSSRRSDGQGLRKIIQEIETIYFSILLSSAVLSVLAVKRVL